MHEEEVKSRLASLPPGSCKEQGGDPDTFVDLLSYFCIGNAVADVVQRAELYEFFSASIYYSVFHARVDEHIGVIGHGWVKNIRVIYSAKELKEGNRLTGWILVDVERGSWNDFMYGGLCEA